MFLAAHLCDEAPCCSLLLGFTARAELRRKQQQKGRSTLDLGRESSLFGVEYSEAGS